MYVPSLLLYMTWRLVPCLRFTLPTFELICAHVYFQGDKNKDQEPGAIDFWRSATIQQKKIQAYALAVQNAIVIDVKVDQDLFLCFLKFYVDENMMC